jgi:hypothetical protein
MLDARAADTGPVVHRIVVWTSWICCALVVASFVLFARDQVAGASAHQAASINSSQLVNPTTSAVHHGQPRAFIDGAAHVLTSPFDSIVNSSNEWVDHGLPTLFALIVYGAGLGYLARFTDGLA